MSSIMIRSFFCTFIVVCLVSCSDDSDDSSPVGDAEIEQVEQSDVPTFDMSQVSFQYCAVDSEEIDSILQGLSLQQKIGQHIVSEGGRQGSGLAEETRQKVEDLGFGGIFLQPPVQIVPGDTLATATLVHDLQALAVDTHGIPLFISLDQEGGANAAINSLTGGTDTIGQMAIGATQDPQIAYEQYDIMGREIRALGFNLALAPAIDTIQTTRNGNMNTRAFGPDAELNAQLALGAFAGFQKNLVIAVGKHFPGDGLTDANTHKVELLNTFSKDFLEENLFPPFRLVVKNGIDGMMTIPCAYEALDETRSAITSRKVTTDFLRGDLGFEGLVATDALGMVGAYFGLEEDDNVGLEALKAGADVLLFVAQDISQITDTMTAIEEALASGELSDEEFNASTRRILEYKMKYCLFEDPVHPDVSDADLFENGVGTRESRDLSASHAEQALTVLDDDGTVLPLTGKKVLYIGPDKTFQDPGSGWLNIVDQTFADAMRRHDSSIDQVVYFLPPDPASVIAEIETKAGNADVIVMGTLQGRFSLEQQQIMEWLLGTVDKPVVHVMLGVPFDFMQTRGRVAVAIALMCSRSVMVEAGTDFLYGKGDALGEILYDLQAEQADGDLDIEGGGDNPTEDRCVSMDIDCSDGGICVDSGGDAFGCVCYPNWHPSEDKLDCIPDGEDLGERR